jgi:signal transduction histidine kinase
MDRPVRIAVVGPVDERLVGDLRQLPLRPEVRPMTSLIGDTELLMNFQPDVLFVQFENEAGEDIGAIRLLQRMWPALRIAVVTTADKEVEMGPVATRISAGLAVYPNVPGQLAAILEQMVHGGERPHPELFVDLAHGLADELNNPLMFVSGHLQLLRASLGSHEDPNRRDQVDAALNGLKRIQTTVNRLCSLSEAANGPGHKEPVDIAALVTRAVSERSPNATAATITMPSGPQLCEGDREQLNLAVAAIVVFADELAQIAASSHLQLDSMTASIRLRVAARGQGLATWQLSNTFEPFYPQRLMRGQSHGLGLFLAQTVVLGHRGQATVRRLADGTLQLDFLLPT